MRPSIIILTAILLFPSFGLSQTTWYVPDDFPKIQDAISSTSVVGGDTIIVRPGTYVENIDFLGKAVTLKSESGPDVTVINGNQAGSVVTFSNGEELDSVLDGFSLTNGTGTYSSSPYAGYYGGGVYCEEASPHIRDNIITGNSVTGTYGGGGGISCLSNSPMITNNYIYENSASHHGGGIACRPSSINPTTPNIMNNIISENSCQYGGGLFCDNDSYVIIINTTVIGNTAVKMGGGIHAEHSTLIITNTILWGNTASSSNEISLFNGTVSVNYCDIAGGWPGTGNIDSDPNFVTGKNGFYYLNQVASGQHSDSPCIDAGSDLASNLGMDTLWTRTDEVSDSGTVDMGFHYGSFSSAWTVPLYQSAYKISDTTGGSSNLYLNVGQEHANNGFLIFGSISGTSPGTLLPPGLVTVPVNWDIFTTLLINLANTPFFSNFLGTLDSNGRGTATLTLPPGTGAAGLSMYYAYALCLPWDFASNPVQIDIVP